jgi:hypothetical protein
LPLFGNPELIGTKRQYFVLFRQAVKGKEIGRQQRELEAEATAYTVCSYFGTQSPSDFYLATYKVTPAMLLEAVETIAATVKTILNGCQHEEVEEIASVSQHELSHACAA